MTPVVPAPTPQPAYIAVSVEINELSTQLLLNMLANCVNQQVPEVHLLMSSPGGSVMHGINVYNVLRGMPFRVITHNVGNVDSIGNAIFLAGEERYACEYSTFMFHGVAWNGGNLPIDAKTTKERLDAVKADEARTGRIISDRSNLTEAQVRAFYKQARTMTAQDALGAGIVHDVRDVAVPATAQVAALVVPH
jgi:ATP-dependent Clp protease protease subunit